VLQDRPVCVAAVIEVVDRLPERGRHGFAMRAPKLGAPAEELDDRLGSLLPVGARTIQSHARVLAPGGPGRIGRSVQPGRGIRRIRRAQGGRTLGP
jgi:hypothetical protein